MNLSDIIAYYISKIKLNTFKLAQPKEGKHFLLQEWHKKHKFYFKNTRRIGNKNFSYLKNAKIIIE